GFGHRCLPFSRFIHGQGLLGHQTVIRYLLRLPLPTPPAALRARVSAHPVPVALVGECSMPRPWHTPLMTKRAGPPRRRRNQREEAMITRVLVTFVVAALGIYAFWDDAMGQGHVLNPFGILFLLLAALIWFGWGPIRESFKSVKEESDIPISRLGSTIIKGMTGLKRGPGRRRSDS